MKNAASVSQRALQTFVRDRRLLRGVAASALFANTALVLLAGGVVYLFTHPPDPKYFFNDTEGNIVAATPVDQPVMSDDDLLQWATKIALIAYNLNYPNYRERLSDDLFPNMTPNGMRSLYESLLDNHNLDEIKTKRLTVIGTPTGGPVFARLPSVQGGVLNWEVQVPIVASFENSSGVRRQDLLLDIVVVRGPKVTYRKGVAIDRLVSRPHPPRSS